MRHGGTDNQLVVDSRTPYDVVMHEAALRMRVGGSKVARAQLEHLLPRPQKSSYSAGDCDNDCLEIATTPTALHALITALKAD